MQVCLCFVCVHTCVHVHARARTHTHTRVLFFLSFFLTCLLSFFLSFSDLNIVTVLKLNSFKHFVC